ncbi:hypothetical protein ACH4MA_25400 [Streptomyces roseolus]
MDGRPASTRTANKRRDTVERAVRRPKRPRAVAPRYDERGRVFPGTATAAAVVLRRRA